MTNFQKTPSEHTATIASMLAYARPHRSAAETQFCQRFLDPLGVVPDKFGNGIKRVGTTPILWSCHTDTVHHKDGRQKLRIADGVMTLRHSFGRGHCLGADDGAGVFLMTEMVKAGIPGLYIFHAGEEMGGLGSRWIAKETPKLLSGIKYAVAFDRKDYSSVITHQGARCCSDEFAVSLGNKLGAHYRCDDTGLFTDTANYTGLVGECTNVSVGYFNEHCDSESLDVRYLLRLRSALLTFDPAGLISKRLPGELDPEYEAMWAKAYDKYDKADVIDRDCDMEDMIAQYPEVVADILRECGMDATSLHKAIKDYGFEP